MRVGGRQRGEHRAKVFFLLDGTVFNQEAEFSVAHDTNAKTTNRYEIKPTQT